MENYQESIESHQVKFLTKKLKIKIKMNKSTQLKNFQILVSMAIFNILLSSVMCAPQYYGPDPNYGGPQMGYGGQYPGQQQMIGDPNMPYGQPGPDGRFPLLALLLGGVTAAATLGRSGYDYEGPQENLHNGSFPH